VTDAPSEWPFGPSADEFEVLWGPLEAHVARRATRPLGPVERRALLGAISEAYMSYGTVRHKAAMARHYTLHELKQNDLLRGVIEVLTNPANREHLLHVLGAPESNTGMIWPERDRLAVERAEAWRSSTLRALEQIDNYDAPPPPATSRGRPSRTRDLRAAVEALVDYWQDVTGERFKQNWHGGEPITPGARFVYLAMKLIDPSRLRELPGVTETIVKDRLAGTNDGGGST
jgi:hypothetical protein